MEYKLNFKRSSIDRRDYLYQSSIINTTELPEVLDYREVLMPVRNQGPQGTCYAQSACCMKEWQERRDYEFKGYFSPQFFYNNRPNKYDDDPNNDEGMFGRDVMKMLKEIGVCEEKDYPYGKIENRKDISPGLYLKSKKNVIESYAQINNIENLKLALYNNGPCLIGMPVYNYSDQLWIKKNNQQMLGGHAMTIVGYNKEGFIIRNSWGETWGDKGYSIYKYNDWGIHWEIWTTLDKYNMRDNEEIIIPGNNINELNDMKCCCVIS